MQIERSATSVSWIPSESVRGLLKIPFSGRVMHYDPPPPLTITDLEGMRRRGEFRFANILRAWIDVEDGTIRGCGHAGGVIMGLTPITVGSLTMLLPTKANQEIRSEPEVTGDAVRFVQTAEPGVSLALVLDGIFEVRVDGQAVGQVGPGTVMGERASLEDGRRTAELRALTQARIAETAPGLLTAEQLSELAQGHRREDSPAGR